MEAAASIINVIQITSVFVEYLRAAKHASSDRRKLLLEAHSLQALLQTLKDFVKLEDQHEAADWRLAVHQLESADGPFAQYASELVDLMDKVWPQRRLQKITQTVLWKLVKEDVNDMLLRLERLKALIVVALELDHTRLSEAILSEVRNVAGTTELIRSDTLKLVTSVDEAGFRSLLDQICPEDYMDVYQSNLTEHTAGVGRIFLSSPHFQRWADFCTSEGILLCIGDPGVGKTVLATKAIKSLQENKGSSRHAVLYVYCDCTRRRSRLNRRDSSPEARDKGVQTPRHFIASLLRQLVDAHGPGPMNQLQTMIKRSGQQKTKPSVAELEQAFSEIAPEFERIYVVVDAMDECDSLELDTFAAHLLSICSTAPSLRLLLTSRRHPHIEQLFKESRRLDIRTSDTDTLQYLQSRAKREFPPRVSRDSKAVEKILNALLVSAKGVPLIARLHMNALRGIRTPGTMLAAIENLRTDSDLYDGTYRAAMERITKQPGELPAMALRVIRWIVCAKRYIYTRELQCILAMADDSDSLEEDFVPDLDDVFLACEGLVCTVLDPVTNGMRLELVHTTARQYFDSNLQDWAPEASLDLTRTCLNVLSFEDMEPLPESLVTYAWRHWGQHAKDVEELHEEDQFAALVDLIRKFMAGEGTGSPLSRVVVTHAPFEYDVGAGVTGYRLATKFGLGRTFEALWESSDNFDLLLETTHYTTNPFFEAVRIGNMEMVKLMLKLHSINPNLRNSIGHNALTLAIFLRNHDLVETLIADGQADPNERDHEGRPLVLLAARLGETRSLEILLSSATMDADMRRLHGPHLRALALMPQTERVAVLSLEDLETSLGRVETEGEPEGY